MMLRAVTLALLVGSSAGSAADGNAAACSALSPGHDFKNGQYAHVNGTSAADW